MNITDFKVKKCLSCGAETDSNDEEEYFCSKCGAPIINRCSDYNCNRFLKESAKFCKYCGAASTFKNYGLFDNAAPFISDNTDDLPF